MGELEKFTRVSGARVAALAPGCGAGGGGLCFTLRGAGGEGVRLAAVDPKGAVRFFVGALPASGAVDVACGCAAGACACAAAGEGGRGGGGAPRAY